MMEGKENCNLFPNGSVNVVTAKAVFTIAGPKKPIANLIVFAL